MCTLGLWGLSLLGCNAGVGLNVVDPDPPPGGDDVEPIEDLPSSGTPDLGGPDPVSDALFDVTRVHRIQVELAEDAIAALAVTPREYVHATVEIEGERFEDVGLRLKGNNSFRPISEKPSFKIRLDEFVAAGAFGRLRGVTLNNMVEDPTAARELLTYWLWNDAGMIAPRAAYAQVYVNDQFYGMYLLLEPMDRAFLQRRFTNPDGDLWEGQDDADFTPAAVSLFDRKSGDGDRAWLETIAAALALPTDDYYASAGRYFQMDQIIDYWAWSMATANLDGYPFTLNDFLVYADPSAEGRLTMSPWGMDESWNPDFVFQWGQGVALFGCAADNACLERVLAHTEAALVHYHLADVPGRLQAFYDLADGAPAPESPATAFAAPWTPAEVEAARADLLSFTETWPAVLRAQMDASR